MTEPAPNEQIPPPQDYEISLLDLAIVLAKHKKLILGLPFAAAVVAAGVSLLMPNVYTATARILPPQQSQSTAAAMLGQLGALAGATGSSLGIKNPNDLYVGMLKSRSVADGLIERYGLQRRYEQETLDDTRKALEKVTKVSAGKDGIVAIEVDDEDPRFAAELANAYVDALHRLNQTLAVTEAAQRRLFFERQLRQTQDSLARAEVELNKVQQATGVVQLDAQGKAAIEAVAALRARIAAKEVELAAMRTFATERNPDYQRLTQELAGLRGQLARFERGGEPSALPSAARLTEAGLDYVRKLREVKYQETVFELLARQFEAAKLDEARNASLIQVLDKAVPPERKSKPRHSLIVIVSALATGLVAVLLAFMREARERALADPERAQRYQALRQHLRWR
jgi:tyrosine-protein kinase Etk/Wzc